MATKIKTNQEIKELRVKHSDIAYMGTEPDFANYTAEQMTEWNLARALNWYNYFVDDKNAKEFIVQYLEHHGQNDKAKLISTVNEKNIVSTYGWVARCVLRGWKLSEKQLINFYDEIERLISLVPKQETIVDDVSLTNRPNVQEIMKKRTLEAGGELEGLWDNFLSSNLKLDTMTNAIDELKSRNILPQHVGVLIQAWEARLKEYQLLLSGKDEQLNEAYKRFSKAQVKVIVRVIEQLIEDLNRYITIKKAGKKPRAKKQIPIAKRVAKLKFLKTFKEDSIDLTSISPEKLYGASEAFIYDTAKRKITWFVADDINKTFVVKGNTLVGFDTKKSITKTVRKPSEFLKSFVNAGRPSTRKMISDIKAVASSPNGRFNANMIIIKAY